MTTLRNLSCVFAAAVLSACGGAKSAGLALKSLYPARSSHATSIDASPALTREGLAKGAWPQDGSDVSPDSALRFGRLANGMGYVLMKNATPQKQASLRLRIAAGSLEERDDQQGLMHFIEHMAFDGSTHVAHGEMIKILERHGLAFGPDTNAFTSFDQTVYQLDLPQTDDETLDTGLMLLRETAGELTLDPAAIDSERGVILSEERLRDTPALHIARKQYDFYYPGDRIAGRFPIGDVATIKSASRAQLADLYNTYYRPDRTVLVAIGDFDLDRMEAKIRARFGDWTAKAPDRPNPDLGPIDRRGTQALAVVEPGGPSAVHLVWISQPDLRPDRQALRRERIWRQIGFAVLNRRFQNLTRAEQPPFLAAGAGRYTTLRTADVVDLGAITRPGAWAIALQTLEQEVRRLAQFGVSQPEIDREITEMRTGLQAEVQGAGTRKTPDLANGVAGSLEDEEVYTSPADDLAEFEGAVKGLQAQTISASMSRQFSGQGPLILVNSPTAVEGGEAGIVKTFEAAAKGAISAPITASSKSWTYTQFGPAPGRAAERKDVLDLDATFVRFANGVRLTVKPTKFRVGQVLVSVRVGNGYRDLPTNRVTGVWAAPQAFGEGGLGRLTKGEMEQVLASRLYGVGLGVNEESFTLSGATRPDDLTLQMQVLAAYLTDAAWRPEPFERMRAYGATLLAQLNATPGGVFAREGGWLLHGKDARWAFPDQQQIKSASLPEVKALIGGPLATDPIEVVIVGDVTVDEAVRVTAETFGALPPRTEHPAAATESQVRFPAPTSAPLRLTHKGRSDQAIGFVAWPTFDFNSDPQGARALRVVEQIVQLRLIDELREKQGVTYSPSTGLDISWVFPGYGYLSAAVEAPPDKLAGFFASVDAIARDLGERPVTADELERAKKPRIETILKSQQSNEYWLTQLGGAQTDPRKLDAIRASVPGLERVQAADVQRMAKAWLRGDRAWRIEITPEPK